MFLTFILTGVRRSERWGHVNLVERTLRVVESKSEDGERLIALPHLLASELERHYAKSVHRLDDDYVFCHPTKGSRMDGEWFRQVRTAREVLGVEGRVSDPRPPSRGAHEPRRRSNADRADGHRGPPLDANDEAIPPPGGHDVRG